MTYKLTTFDKLCYACRIGDVESADLIISTGVNLNSVDEFDNSPLFLASLCGHEEVVRLLLTRGAVCDRDRYEGARCIYGALTDEIRNILLVHDISKAVDLKQPFASHISSLLTKATISTFDFKIKLKDSLECFTLHKFMLQARCPNLLRVIEEEFVRNGIDSFECLELLQVYSFILKFIYLVPVLHEVSSSVYKSLSEIAKKLELHHFSKFIEQVQLVLEPAAKSTLMAEYQYTFTEIARQNMKEFVITHMLKNFQVIGDCDDAKCQEKIKLLECSSAYPDISIMVAGEDKKIRLYPAHLAILSRSPYFKMLFSLPFTENDLYSKWKIDSSCFQLPVVTFPHHDYMVVETVLRFLYYDSTEIPLVLAPDILLIADILMEERLKSNAAVVITQSKKLPKFYSIFEILDLAWKTSTERLEHFVAELISNNVKHFCSLEEFEIMVEKSSKRISHRQETDTIELIDDIRYYLLKKYSLEVDDIEYYELETDSSILESSGISEYRADLEILEKLLQKLNLSA